MKYTNEHAKRAREIMIRLQSYVAHRPEYAELIEILGNPTRWKEAHGQFSKIRTNITLPMVKRKNSSLEDCFVCIAENAAKTAYNCSGEAAPFDNDSFEKLIKCEKEFINQIEKVNNASKRTESTRSA